MTNGEKYKTVKERAEAFDAFCNSRSSKCDLCPLNKACDDETIATFAWLELESEDEKPLPCPFCGSENVRMYTNLDMFFVRCVNCSYISSDSISEKEAIAAHNRVARAVMATKEKEAK